MRTRTLTLPLCALLITALIGATVAPVTAEDQSAPVVEHRPAPADPVIQIALLLDTSNSMDGLINQAKTHLWKIVNEFATAKQGGRRPQLQVALFEYGNNGLSQEQNFIRQVLPLTTDLDKVSEQLFKLKTNGGKEYCGAVIQQAARTLSWSASGQDYKAIFIAGNEPFTQGPIQYAQACKEAIGKGIIVNTIHCGPSDQGIAGKWQDGALLADGSFANIDQNRQVAQISAPQDKQIAELNVQLNGTYVTFGRKGEAGKARQVAQDQASAELAAPVLVQRAASKASAFYSNAEWDLIDAIRLKKVKLEDVKDADLPEVMRKMSLKERRAYIEKQTKARAALQAQIKALADARRLYVAEQQKKQADAGGQATLDEAVVKTVREQAARKNFKFE